MGRSSKDKNEEEHLRGLLRQLKAENRHLKKQLGRLEKQAKITESFQTWPDEEDYAPPAPEEAPIHKCPKCGKQANLIDLGKKKVLNCTHCGKRSTK